MHAAPFKKQPNAVVIFDSKNFSHECFEELRRKGVDAHIFVATKGGEISHNPAAKGNDYAPSYRSEEMAEISTLHSTQGVVAVVVIPSIFFKEDDVLSCIAEIRKLDPNIKIIAHGGHENQWGGDTVYQNAADFVTEDANDNNALLRLLREHNLVGTITPSQHYH